MLPHPPRTMPTFRSELGMEEGEHGGCMGGPLGMMKQTSHVAKGASSSVECKPHSQNVSPLSGPQAGCDR